MPADADKVVITDILAEKDSIGITSKASEVTVEAIGKSNDHKAHGTVENAPGQKVENAQVTVGEGGKSLEVTIPEASGLRGQWVRVTYQVKLDNDKVGDIDDYNDDDIDVFDNKTVISDEYPNGNADNPSHDGVATSASYEVYVGEGDEPKYALEANTITVTPPVEGVSVEKSWTRDGESIDWPEGAEVTLAIGEGSETLDEVTLKAGAESAKFTGFPVYESKQYTVVEKDVKGIDAKSFKMTVNGDALEGYNVVNDITTTGPETGTLVINKTVGGDVSKSELENGAITFEVTTTVNGKKMWLGKDGKLVAEKATITLGEADGWTTKDGGKTWTKTWNRVTPSDYTVTETNAELDGFTLVTSKSTTKATAKVTAGSAVTANLKDVYKKQSDKPKPETTSVTVNKYLTGSTTYVSNAKLQIVDKSSGTVIASWTTSAASHTVSGLTVGKTYILKETQAPSGYTKAADVEFKVTTKDSLLIISGAKTSAGKANAACAGTKISLYDAKVGSITPRTPTKPATTAQTTNRNNPQTGDSTGDIIGILGLVSLAAIGLFEFARRRRAEA